MTKHHKPAEYQAPSLADIEAEVGRLQAIVDREGFRSESQAALQEAQAALAALSAPKADGDEPLFD